MMASLECRREAQIPVKEDEKFLFLDLLSSNVLMIGYDSGQLYLVILGDGSSKGESIRVHQCDINPGLLIRMGNHLRYGKSFNSSKSKCMRKHALSDQSIWLSIITEDDLLILRRFSHTEFDKVNIFSIDNVKANSALSSKI